MANSRAQDANFAQSKAVATAVSRHVQSAEYNPPPLPIVPPEGWASILDVANEPVSYERLAVGTEVLKFGLFMLVSELESFRGKPVEFVKIVRQAVSSPNVLREIVHKMDPDLANQCDVEQLATGFRYFIGYLWGLATQNIDFLTPTLRPIFEPLLKVAATAYDTHPYRQATRSKPAEQESAEEKNRKYVVGFLKVVQSYQAPRFEDDDSSTSEPEQCQIIMYSPPAIPFFDLGPLSPLDPALLARQQPPSPPRDTLPQLRDLDRYAAWATSSSPGSLEVEMGLPELLDERPDDNMLLYQPPPPDLVLKQELCDLFEERENLKENSDRFGPPRTILQVGPSDSRPNEDELRALFDDVVKPEDENDKSCSPGPSKNTSNKRIQAGSPSKDVSYKAMEARRPLTPHNR
ncbi:hypothetical protein B0H12DRAFT_1113304 [Mycena haematopus]|nr:hypothetical protein B0H12DRAFT_1113304 [Mycena haematopus]